jgi:hypothetical protein
MLDAASNVVIYRRVGRSNPVPKTHSHLVPYEHVSDIPARNDRVDHKHFTSSMLITNCCTSNRHIRIQNERNGLYPDRTVYSSGYLVAHDLCKPQDLSNGHTSLLLRQFV